MNNNKSKYITYEEDEEMYLLHFSESLKYNKI